MEQTTPGGRDERRSNEVEEEAGGAASGEGEVEEASKESFPASDPPGDY